MEGRNGGELIPYEKGRSGNPNGRPKGMAFKTILNEILDLPADMTVSEVQEYTEKLGRKLTNREIMLIRMMAKAITDPESKSMQHILDRVEGKPQQSIDVTSNGVNVPIVDWVKTESPDDASE